MVSDDLKYPGALTAYQQKCEVFLFDFVTMIFARRGAHLAAERSPSGARADGARRSAAVPNGEGVASGSATNKFAFFNGFFIFTIKIQHTS